ncbi:hypothetical protein [Methylobacterium frigidaeris]|uniref:MFS transporter n=1 Tax=Methylobacterium frigidaeris TaxID=2038277 RepID=A0AA37M785_9HYPH|nr:hypothetical protein [Methylobacterium frigidaeris]GJD65620.1 hypothetical protein MPEAHAMD_5815 [Methylobacterium frigidaeris]
MPGHSQFRLLTLHYSLYQLSVALAGGFVGAYLLKLGFSLPAALSAYAALLSMRFGLRFISLSIVRRVGYQAAIVLGTILVAAQFLPLMGADKPYWLVAWLLVVSLAESLYWPVYHAAAAVTGGEARGREVGIRAAAGALANVLGPLAGGALLEHFGPAVDFAIAALISMMSVAPLLALKGIAGGPVPSIRESVRSIDRSGFATFAADGWMASGLAIAWPMTLFLSLDLHFAAFGVANAAAGVMGAVTGLLCGSAIDRGGRDRCLALVSCALVAGFILRTCATWSPLAATLANASGAAVQGLYVPVLMTVIYDSAKQSGAAYRFNFAAEAGWDIGAASGCLAAALVAGLTQVPSLAVLPAVLGVGVFYHCVRGQSHPLRRPLGLNDEVSAA